MSPKRFRATRHRSSRLVSDDVPVRIRIVDIEGRPVAGALTSTTPGMRLTASKAVAAAQCDLVELFTAQGAGSFSVGHVDADCLRGNCDGFSSAAHL